MGSSDETKFAVVGDSISTGYGVADGNSYIDIMHDNEYSIEAWAENGATNVRWLYEYPERLESIEQYEPDKTIIMLGGNSYLIGRSTEEWYTYTNQLMYTIEDMAPDTEIILVSYYDLCAYGLDCESMSEVCDVQGFCDNKPVVRPTWEEYREAMQEFSSDNGVVYIEISNPDASMIGDDMAHMNDSGHNWYANELMSRLGQ